MDLYTDGQGRPPPKYRCVRPHNIAAAMVIIGHLMMMIRRKMKINALTTRKQNVSTGNDWYRN
jgi:hypothetical protein